MQRIERRRVAVKHCGYACASTPLLALISILVVSGAGCRRPATVVELIIGTDAPPDRAFEVQVLSLRGAVSPTEVEPLVRARALASTTIARPPNTAELPLITLLPAPNSDGAPITVWIRARASASAAAPEVVIDRVLQLAFIAQSRGRARVFLPLRCGDRAIGCTSVGGEQCTVSIRCREQGATCGDLGECVAPEIIVESDRDGAVIDGATPTIDATTGRADAPSDREPLEGSASDAGCDGGIVCDNRCVQPMTDVNHCGMCGRTCAATDVCVLGNCAPAVDCAQGSRAEPSRSVRPLPARHGREQRHAPRHALLRRGSERGPWTVVFETAETPFSTASAAAMAWRLPAALAMRSSRAMVAYRDAALAVIDPASAASFALPPPWSTLNPFAVGQMDIPLMIRVENAKWQTRCASERTRSPTTVPTRG